MSENRKFIFNMQAIALLVYGISMIPSFLMSFHYGEIRIFCSLFIISIGSILFGIIAHHLLSNELSNVTLRICYVTTITVWLIVIFLSSLPYYASGEGYSFIDCLYTATASWTTCGTTAIPIDSLPIGLLIWRSTCNWMGGIGIVLLTLTFLPSWQFIGQRLASTEIRGPRFLMSNMTFRKAYRRIIILYLTFTLLQYTALRLCGMTNLAAILTALSNTSTSGILHLNNGVIAAYPTSIKAVISLFAFLSSINISVFVLLILGKFRSLKRNTEFTFYISYVVIITVLFTSIMYFEEHPSLTLGFIGTQLMQIVSFTSTAGFIVMDCTGLSAPCITIIIVIMFIGSCAISTGGGIKISRICMALSCVKTSMFRTLHPHAIRDIRYNGEPTASEDIARINVYILLFMVLFFAGSLALTIEGTPVIDALAYSQAMLTNTGTPITGVTDPSLLPTFGAFSKLVLSFLMLCGRLEIYPVLLIFSRGFFITKEN